MSTPREILNRIQRRQARREALRGPDAARTPAPAPAAIPAPASPAFTPPTPRRDSIPAPAPSVETPHAPIPPTAPQPPASPARQAIARPAGSHALYSELMRSHDRMGTRHLEKR